MLIEGLRLIRESGLAGSPEPVRECVAPAAPALADVCPPLPEVPECPPCTPTLSCPVADTDVAVHVSLISFGVAVGSALTLIPCLRRNRHAAAAPRRRGGGVVA